MLMTPSRRRVSMTVWLVTLTGGLGMGAKAARAGTFTAFTCHDPSGHAIGARGWTEQRLGGYFISTHLDCTTAGDAISSQVGPGGPYSESQGTQMYYTPPEGETITSYALNVSAYANPCPQAGGGCTGGVGEVWLIHTGDSDPNYDWRILGSGNWGPGQLTESGLHAAWVSTQTSCDDYPNLTTWTCPGGQVIARVAISSGVFKLYDSTIPSVKAVSGPLVSGRTLTGTAAIHFTATDSGSGIYSALILVDGNLVGEQPLDSNGGLCVNLGQTSDGTRSFAAPQPCAMAVNATATVNTSQLSTGQHHLQVLVDDAAGDQDTVFDGTIKVKRAHIPNGTPCRGEQLNVRLNHRRRRVIIDYGRRIVVTGYLHCGTKPVRHARVLISGDGLAADVKTDRKGTFAYVVPRGPDRHLTISYTAYADDPGPIVTARATIDVKPVISLSITPLRTQNHHTIFWSGSITPGPYPARGVGLLVQVREGHRWVTFDQLVAEAGRFSYHYTFARTRRPTIYEFRISLPYGGAAGYPYSQSASRPIDVLVS